MSKVLFLMPQGSREQDIKTHYINLLPPATDYKVEFLPRFQKGQKVKIAELREVVKSDYQHLLDESDYTIVCEAQWFQAIYKNCKPVSLIGYKLNDSNGNNIFFAPNPFSMLYDNSISAKVAQAISAVNACIYDSYSEPGKDIIHSARYLTTKEEISKELLALLEYPSLACDIETRSLCHIDAGIVSIAFAWNEHEGSALYINNDPELLYMLKCFFVDYRGKLIFHNISYDVYVMIYVLFMKNPLDQEGLLHGLDMFLNREWEDTKLITYLATNSAAGNTLGLKPNTQEFSGNYAIEEIDEIDTVPVDKLLKYNLIDVLSTNYLLKKYYNKMVADAQLEIYENQFKPMIKDIIQMQLSGMPMDMEQVKKTKAILQADSDAAVEKMMALQITKDFIQRINEEWVEWKNSTLKTKRVGFADAHEEFNPRSSKQLSYFLYDILGLPILKRTKTKAPSVDGETLKDLMSHTQDTETKSLLEALVAFKEVDKILTSFIPAFEKATPYGGWHWLYGHFNLGGTVSGRLSSSDPNLQNLPSTGSKYAHIIKECFKAPPGWLMIGIDFASLEDRISALTTKDPEKLKVYTDGYDGHCLRAFSYFADEMPDIKAQIEEIKKEGKTFKVTHDDGHVEYLNENNPKLQEYMNQV